MVIEMIEFEFLYFNEEFFKVLYFIVMNGIFCFKKLEKLSKEFKVFLFVCLCVDIKSCVFVDELLVYDFLKYGCIFNSLVELFVFKKYVK